MDTMNDMPSVEDFEDDFGLVILPEIDEEWNEWWWANTYPTLVKHLADMLETTPEDYINFALESLGAPTKKVA